MSLYELIIASDKVHGLPRLKLHAVYKSVSSTRRSLSFSQHLSCNSITILQAKATSSNHLNVDVQILFIMNIQTLFMIT